MNNIIKTILTILIILATTIVNTQDIKETDSRDTLLKEIAQNINAYKDKVVTLRLKLKHVDKIFEKITFYDKKNHDIEFNISDRFLKKRIAPDMLNIHEGMLYNVSFIVQNVGNLGQIIAELKGFKPVILDFFPEDDKK